MKALAEVFQNLAENVTSLEGKMLECEQTPCPVVHRFGPGIYIREVTVPSGTLTIGHHQNLEQTNIMLKGRVTILNEDGSSRELKAPMIFVGPPGRKVGFVHEEMVWLNVYATDEQDVEKLESMYLTKSFQWHEALETKCLSLENLSDYEAMLNELGMTENVVRAQSENLDDQTPLPHGGYKIKVAKSSIEGQGLFATADIEPGEVIAPARISGKRTVAGRFTNHSKNPNAKMQRAFGQDILLVALKPIRGCRGGLDGEEITVDYRQAIKINLEIGGLKCQE